ncbi:MAG: IS30 family transposase [Clostridia bacterium]|nr:IS30 family transposase [Clostridia bacterium]
MDHKHITTFERGRIEALNQLGYTVRQIGNKINRHHSTVARELARNNRLNYCSETAQSEYILRHKSSKTKGKDCPKLVSAIEQGLKATWSPE